MSALGLPGDRDTQAVLAASHAYCRDLGIEMSLAKQGAQQQDLPLWAEEAFAIKRLIDNNPRALGVSSILSIYQSAF